MKTYRKLLIILWMFMAGCAIGGFDITQPLVRLPPAPQEKAVQRVNWIDYNDKGVSNLIQTADRCILFYFKRELSCGECEILDKSFLDDSVVKIANHHFINIKVTDDMNDFEKGMQRMDIKDTPYVVIINVRPYKILVSKGGLIDTRTLTDMIFDALGECYRYD